MTPKVPSVLARFRLSGTDEIAMPNADPLGTEAWRERVGTPAHRSDAEVTDSNDHSQQRFVDFAKEVIGKENAAANDGREEAMQWLESNDGDYIFAFPGNKVLATLVSQAADYLRIAHAFGSKDKLRRYTSVEYRVRSWSRPRRVIARIEVSLQPNPNEPGCMGQEVDVRYVVTSLAGDPRRLYAGAYCTRGQMEPSDKIAHHARGAPCSSSVPPACQRRICQPQGAAL